MIPSTAEILTAWQFLARRIAEPSARRQETVLEGEVVIRESSLRQ